MRQEILLNQLLLRGKQTFFAVRSEFDFVRASGNAASGVFGWWCRNVFGSKNGKNNFPFSSYRGDADGLAERLFVLEYFPYRSTAPDRTIGEGNFFLDRMRGSAYGRFWQQLVQYALYAGKRIIVRAERGHGDGNLIVSSLKTLGAREDRLYWLKSRQNVSLSEKNVSGPKPFKGE